jgi:hypothetical protein
MSWETQQAERALRNANLGIMPSDRTRQELYQLAKAVKYLVQAVEKLEQEASRLRRR